MENLKESCACFEVIEEEFALGRSLEVNFNGDGNFHEDGKGLVKSPVPPLHLPGALSCYLSFTTCSYGGGGVLQ